MTCLGCEFSPIFFKDPGYTGINPVLTQLDFFEDSGTNPNGTCTGNPCAQANPCTPVGSIGFGNCYPQPIQVKWRAMPGGANWQWDQVNCGGSFGIRMVGDKSVDCGDKFLMAEVWDYSQDPAVKLGELYAGCSVCGEQLPDG